MAANAWELASVTASTVTDLITTTATPTTVGSLHISNNSGVDTLVSVYVTDGSNTVVATLADAYSLTAGSSVKLGNVVLKASRKLRVESGQALTSFYASGWED